MMTDDEVLLQELEDSTKKAMHLQLQTLRSILDHQAGTHYLQQYLSGYSEKEIDAATFRRLVPLSSYEDYADHINRMAEGDNDNDTDHDQAKKSLSVDPLLCFFYSSGTSSMKPKLIPYFDSALSRATSYVAHKSSAAILRRVCPPTPEANKNLTFIYADGVATTTRGGFKVMAASSYPLQRTTKANWSQVFSCTSPREVIFGTNIGHQMYCHLLCALRECDSVDGIFAPYAPGLVRAFGMLESKWEQLCDDLANGFLTLEIYDATMRESVAEVLAGPQVDLSKRVRGICQANEWYGILSKLWPNVRCVKCVSTGSMKQYYSKIKYYAGDVMILGGDYFASECPVGINLDIKQPPETTRFVMLPNAAYFEFLPFDLDKNSSVGEETVDFSGVKLGKAYEVVVTTYRGLYRYRLGDIVRVVGFHNSSPEVEFMMRAPKGDHEVITERDLMSAMDRFQLAMKSAMSAEIVEFASFFDFESSPKQLKVFVEVRDGCVLLQERKLRQEESVQALKRCCASFEKGLGGVYKVQRDRDEVGPLLVSILRTGTFDRVLQLAVENGAPVSQYKPLKIIRNHEIVHFMEASALLTVCLDSSDG